MQSITILFSALVVLFPFCLATVHSQEYEQGDPVQIQLAAFNPVTPPADKKKPLTRKDVNSGAFQKIRKISRVGLVEIRMLYETSGAKDFKEFSRAFIVARNLRFDPQIVLRALWEQSLKEVLQDFGLPEDQAKRALKIARDQLEYANEEWKKGRPVQ
jgi:hypothetical protein